MQKYNALLQNLSKFPEKNERSLISYDTKNNTFSIIEVKLEALFVP